MLFLTANPDSEVTAMRLRTIMTRTAALITIVLGARLSYAAEPELLARWPLGARPSAAMDSRLPARERDLSPVAKGPGNAGAVAFNGRTSGIDVDASTLKSLGTSDFTVTAWVNADDLGHEPVGDLVSQFNSATRTGFHLGIYTQSGVTNSQANRRQLFFGLDAGRTPTGFEDHGRLGNAVFIFALCVHRGQLYASTCEAGEHEAGHVFRFEGGTRWKDLGRPDNANAISAMTTYQGELYVASSKYRLGGSSLAESTNPNFGGKVFRLGPGDQWIPCGSLGPEVEAVSSLIEFRGSLYAGSLYRPAGFFRYEGGDRWTSLPTPEGKRVEAMTVFQDALYASSYDDGSVFRFNGKSWESLGVVPDATQTYGFAVHRGDLYVSEWPRAHVYRFQDHPERQWIDTGKLGNELEAMPLVVYNGSLYCGSLPTAEVYRLDPAGWTNVGRVDHTPDVKYRRAWSMAIFQGRLFVGALPSGRVQSLSAGQCVSWDEEFPEGWRHIAAVRKGAMLQLFVDGKLAAEQQFSGEEPISLDGVAPLRIGNGAQNTLRAHLSDLRLYRGALDPGQIQGLADQR